VGVARRRTPGPCATRRVAPGRVILCRAPSRTLRVSALRASISREVNLLGRARETAGTQGLEGYVQRSDGDRQRLALSRFVLGREPFVSRLKSDAAARWPAFDLGDKRTSLPTKHY
jgi:hypothetical protein